MIDVEPKLVVVFDSWSLRFLRRVTCDVVSCVTLMEWTPSVGFDPCLAHEITK